MPQPMGTPNNVAGGKEPTNQMKQKGTLHNGPAAKVAASKNFTSRPGPTATPVTVKKKGGKGAMLDPQAVLAAIR